MLIFPPAVCTVVGKIGTFMVEGFTEPLQDIQHQPCIFTVHSPLYERELMPETRPPDVVHFCRQKKGKRRALEWRTSHSVFKLVLHCCSTLKQFLLHVSKKIFPDNNHCGSIVQHLESGSETLCSCRGNSHMGTKHMSGVWTTH